LRGNHADLRNTNDRSNRSAQTEAQRFVFALNAKDAGDALAAGEFFQLPTTAKFSWRVDPNYVWVASLATAGTVIYRYE